MKKQNSAIFRKLFHSYVILISVIFVMMLLILIVKDYTGEKQQLERRAQLAAEQAALLLDTRISAIKTAVNRINTSTTIRSLYFNILENQQIEDAYTLENIMTELKMFQIEAEQNGIEEIVIFINGYEKGYTGHGIITFDDPFVYHAQIPEISFDNIEAVADISNSRRFTLLRDTLVYCGSYTYGSGSPKGIICVSLNLDLLKKDLAEVTEGAPVRLLLDGQEVFSNISQNGRVFSADSQLSQRLRCEIAPDMGIGVILQGISPSVLLLCVVPFAVFLYFSWKQAKKHYEPFQNIQNLVIPEENGQGEQGKERDEMNRVIEGIKDLIVERNGYRERMINIRPYAQNGMLHGMFNESMERGMLQVLSQEEYLDMKKPFFSIAAVNVFRQDQQQHSDGEDPVSKAFYEVTRSFSTQQMKVVYYRKDENNFYLIANSESHDQAEAVSCEIYRFLKENLEPIGCVVTLGVDDVKDDFSQLGEAYEHARSALRHMLLYGRGEIYYYEEKIQPSTTEAQYYFPKNSVMRLAKMIREHKNEEIRTFLQEIYLKNREMGERVHISVRTLIDEIHITVIKSLREVNELNSFHISLAHIQDNATLQEAISYYIAALEAVVRRMEDGENQEEPPLPDEQISEFIRQNCFNSEISLKMIADRFQVSNKYISVVCKKMFGMTYLQYIHDKRIARAIDLLRTTDQSIEQIAQAVGYTSLLTFRRNFQQVTGVNPSLYREEAKQ